MMHITDEPEKKTRRRYPPKGRERNRKVKNKRKQDRLQKEILKRKEQSKTRKTKLELQAAFGIQYGV